MTSKEGGRGLRGDQRIIDDAARRRRQRKQLEQLEQDNFQDDPHANLTWHKNRPKFEDPNDKASKQIEQQARKKRKIRGERSKVRFAKKFYDLLAEEEIRRPDDQGPNYLSSQAPPSQFPARHFCCVCGFFSNYTCIQCGMRYCGLKCLEHHKETRCQKWTA